MRLATEGVSVPSSSWMAASPKERPGGVSSLRMTSVALAAVWERTPKEMSADSSRSKSRSPTTVSVTLNDVAMEGKTREAGPRVKSDPGVARRSGSSG